ncbi:C40 family peptidase [Nakamurella deserti]|uniref:C40 family peptidase n=1 Tax=Nakamurella deserti TaxID=2164074 RepID=UPI001300A24E|nr:C40 family peptidase [Nakamurella deserti]
MSRFRRGVVVLAVATAATLALGAAPVLTAAADPTTTTEPSVPSTAAGAKELWLQASQQAEALNEQSLQAAEAVDASAAAVTAADAAVAAATAAVGTAEGQRTQAQAVVDSYSGKLSAFANASFRGARMSELSSLLTADSADDYLDSVTALDRVAGDTSDMLVEARDAKTAADAAALAVDAKKTEAETAQRAAVQANADAVTAQQTLAASKTALDAQVAEYQALYDQLTEQEREAAILAEQARLAAEAEAAAASAAAAAAAAPAVENAPAAEVAVAGTSASAAPSSGAAPKAAVPAVSAPNAKAQIAVEAALSKVGSRYVFGAAGPDQFDCSGLTSWAWKQAGVSIPRTSGGQAGLQSVPMDQLQPGDLVTYYSPVHHVAMYIGNGQIVHASTSSKPVYVTSVNYGGPNASGHRVG